MRTSPGRRSLVVVGLVVLGLGASALAQANSNIGTWTLNAAKSTYSPGPAPKGSATLKIEAAGTAVTVTVDAVAADGGTQHWSFTGAYDGKDVPVAGNPSADTVSRKRISPTTTESTYKKAGKVTTVHTGVVDGKTLTITVKGTNPQGVAMNNVQVYDKKS